MIRMLLSVAVFLVLAKMPSASIKSPRQRPAWDAWWFSDYCTWQSWSRPLRMSSSHPYLSPNAPSSRLLAACHPEYRHERQQHTKSGRNGQRCCHIRFDLTTKPCLVTCEISKPYLWYDINPALQPNSRRTICDWQRLMYDFTGAEISGGGLGTPFSSYNALGQPPCYKKTLLSAKKHFLPTNRLHRTRRKPFTKRTLILHGDQNV